MCCQIESHWFKFLAKFHYRESNLSRHQHHMEGVLNVQVAGFNSQNIFSQSWVEPNNFR